MAGPGDITMVDNAVHNPNEPRHFMRIVPAGSAHSAAVDGITIVHSDSAMIVKEVGRDIYDAVVYFPRADVTDGVLSPIDKTTHCPVKGNTEYFDLLVGGERIPEAAWSYVADIIDGAGELEGRIAFDTSKVTVT